MKKKQTNSIGTGTFFGDLFGYSLFAVLIIALLTAALYGYQNPEQSDYESGCNYLDRVSSLEGEWHYVSNSETRTGDFLCYQVYKIEQRSWYDGKQKTTIYEQVRPNAVQRMKVKVIDAGYNRSGVHFNYFWYDCLNKPVCDLIRIGVDVK